MYILGKNGLPEELELRGTLPLPKNPTRQDWGQDVVPFPP